MNSSRLRRQKYQRAKTPADSGSYWPERVQKLFTSVAQIPLIAVTTLCTVLGTGLLFLYFRSIGQPFTDFTAVVGLAIAAICCCVGVLISVGVMLWMPLLGLMPYEADSLKPKNTIPFSSGELFCISVFSASVVLICIVIMRFWDCAEPPGIWTIVALLASCLTGAVILEKALQPKTVRHKAGRLCVVVLYGVLTFMPFSVLFTVRPLFDNRYVDSVVVALGLWVCVSLFTTNPKLTNQPLVTGAVFGVLTLVIVVWIPLYTGQATRLSTMIAVAIGLRSQDTQTLGVPKATCLQLQQATADAGLAPPNPKCEHETWNKIEAQVLSNLGTNWMLELRLSPTSGKLVQTVSFNVSIPAAGVQQSRMVKPPNSHATLKSPSCAAPSEPRT